MRVRIIEEKAGTALIEWIEDSETQRAWVPASSIKDNEVENPNFGIEYGDDFAEVQPATIGPDEIKAALKKNGLWTYADIRAKPAQAQAAIHELTALTMRPLLREAKARR